MNKNTRRLYNMLNREEIEHFTMEIWGNGVCNSPRCIGGTAEFMMYVDEGRPQNAGEVHEGKTAKYLGLQRRIAHVLFFPGGHLVANANVDPWRFGRFTNRGGGYTPYSATQKEAAQALKRAVKLSASHA